MNTTALIVLPNEIPSSALPAWDQFSQERQQELIQALAALLLQLPQIQTLEAGLSTPGAGNEQSH